jgi:hypothetical protein
MPRRLLVACLLVATLPAVAACGSSSEAPEAQPKPSAAITDFPKPTGRTMQEIQAGLRKDLVFAPSISVLAKGVDRVGFAVFDKGGKQIQGAGVALYISKVDGRDVHGPFVARSESLRVKPQFESKTTSTDPQAARSVYVADVRFPRNGKYAVLGVVKTGGKTVSTDAYPLDVGLAKITPPGPGDKAPVIHTLTPADVGGDLAKIDTRLPPAPQLLKTDFADVVGRKPVVLTFATPQLCASRVCGPVVDVVAEVQARTGDGVAFVHQEIYKDNEVSKGLRPQLAAYRLQTEPWTFVIDRTGRISARLEGAFSPGELERAVQKVRSRP